MTKPAAPDVRQLRAQELPEATFPGGRNQHYRVFIRPAAHAAVWKHANEQSGVEICGVLVGRLARDADGPFALVEDSIRGEAAASKFAEVTFTHETWAKINQQMDTRFQDLAIVGWYHSHPDFGIFLSDRDRFIQEHFFNGPGQFALVVDPVRKTEGVFLWKDGKPALTPYFWVGDDVHASTAAGDEAAHAAGPPPTPASLTAPAASGPGGRPPEYSLATLWLLGVSLVAVGFLMARYLTRTVTADDLFRFRQESVALALLQYTFRPGLETELGKLGGEIDHARNDVAQLGQEQLKSLEGDAATAARDRWKEALGRLDRAARRARDLRVEYAPDPETLDLYLKLLDARRRPQGAGPPDKGAKEDEKKAEEVKSTEKKSDDPKAAEKQPDAKKADAQPPAEPPPGKPM